MMRKGKQESKMEGARESKAQKRKGKDKRDAQRQTGKDFERDRETQGKRARQSKDERRKWRSAKGGPPPRERRRLAELIAENLDT
jgi:hypothetical protein